MAVRRRRVRFAGAFERDAECARKIAVVIERRSGAVLIHHRETISEPLPQRAEHPVRDALEWSVAILHPASLSDAQWFPASHAAILSGVGVVRTADGLASRGIAMDTSLSG